MGPPTLDDLEKFDFSDETFEDPLGIAMSWEDKHGKKKARRRRRAIRPDGGPAHSRHEDEAVRALRLHRELYAGHAVDEARQGLRAARARSSAAKRRLTGSSRSRRRRRSGERRVAGELGNYALGLSVRTRAREDDERHVAHPDCAAGARTSRCPSSTGTSAARCSSRTPRGTSCLLSQRRVRPLRARATSRRRATSTSASPSATSSAPRSIRGELDRAPPRAEDVPRLRAEPAHRRRDAPLQRDVRLLPRVARRHGRDPHRHDRRRRPRRPSTQSSQSTNPSVTIEFQGGEPLVNFPVVKHIIEYAREKNKAAGKRLEFTMVSNLSLMDEEKLAYLVDNKVQICTSIDGPRAPPRQAAQAPRASRRTSQATHWIKRINEAYAKMGLDPTLYHVEALLTTTRETLPHWKEIVDTYVDLGCRALFLRPVDPFGFADKTAPRVEYPRAEYLRLLPERGRLHPRAEQAGASRSSSASRPSSSRRSSAARTRTSSTSAPRAAPASGRSPTTTTARSSPATRGGCSTRWATATFLIGDVARRRRATAS